MICWFVFAIPLEADFVWWREGQNASLLRLVLSPGFKDAVFLATISEYSISSLTDPLVFDETKINPGGHYDNTTGIFTVPVDGVYEITSHLYNSPDVDNFSSHYIKVDGLNVTYSVHSDYTSEEVERVSLSSTVLLSLTRGQQVWVYPYLTDGVYGSSGFDYMFSWFTGHLISAN